MRTLVKAVGPVDRAGGGEQVWETQSRPDSLLRRVAKQRKPGKPKAPHTCEKAEEEPTHPYCSEKIAETRESHPHMTLPKGPASMLIRTFLGGKKILGWTH